MERNVLKGRLVNKDDKNRHCVLLIIDISKHGAKAPSSCKKQINKHNSYLLLALLQSGSVPELDMHVSKHFLPGQFIHSEQGVIHWTVRCGNDITECYGNDKME
jgi:hypothetical protein